ALQIEFVCVVPESNRIAVQSTIGMLVVYFYSLCAMSRALCFSFGFKTTFHHRSPRRRDCLHLRAKYYSAQSLLSFDASTGHLTNLTASAKVGLPSPTDHNTP